MRMKKGARHDFINPVIAPEVMKNVLCTFFREENYLVHSWDYFTAKNVVTGNIEATDNTHTIHHFASQYHSQEWHKWRKLRQKIFTIFGEKGFFTRPLQGLITLMQKNEEVGLRKVLRYYWKKYVIRR
jgi:hypothetical protein